MRYVYQSLRRGLPETYKIDVLNISVYNFYQMFFNVYRSFPISPEMYIKEWFLEKFVSQLSTLSFSVQEFQGFPSETKITEG